LRLDPDKYDDIQGESIDKKRATSETTQFSELSTTDADSLEAEPTNGTLDGLTIDA